MKIKDTPTQLKINLEFKENSRATDNCTNSRTITDDKRVLGKVIYLENRKELYQRILNRKMK